jgi:hypothetical protein
MGSRAKEAANEIRQLFREILPASTRATAPRKMAAKVRAALEPAD